MITGLGDRHPAPGITLDQDHTLRPDLLLLHPPNERVEIMLSRVNGRVGGHDHIKGLTHTRAPFAVTCPAKGRLGSLS